MSENTSEEVGLRTHQSTTQIQTQTHQTTTRNRTGAPVPPPQPAPLQQTTHVNQIQMVMSDDAFDHLEDFDDQELLEDVTREAPMNPMYNFEQRKAEKDRRKAAKAEDERQYEEMKANPFRTAIGGDTLLHNKTFVNKVLKSRSTVRCADGQSYTQQELMQQAKDGDYSNIQHLNPLLLNNMTVSYFYGLTVTGIDATSSADDVVNALLRAGGVAALMNPLLRMGVSMRRHGVQIPGFLGSKRADFFDELEDKLNAAIFAKTLSTTAQADPANGITDEDVARNLQQRKLLMKTAFLAHYCHVKQITNGHPVPDNDGDYRRSIGSMFSVPVRTMIILPHDPAEGSAPTESFMGRKVDGVLGGTTGFEKRTAATHSVQRPTKDGTVRAKEEKVPFYNLVRLMQNQYGTNLAVGGLGNDGLAGPGGTVRKIRGDGSCGHIYMHVQEGDETHDTCMLMGIESDAPGLVNQTGHKHSMSATRENFSNFGARAEDLAGDRYGGRVLDVRGKYRTATAFKMEMEALDGALGRMLTSNAAFAKQNIEYVSKMLSGKIMTAHDLDQVKGIIMQY